MLEGDGQWGLDSEEPPDAPPLTDGTVVAVQAQRNPLRLETSSGPLCLQVTTTGV